MRYIGARYVVKIYENSLDPSSAEWEAAVNYEPLTMVTYNNGSYLSKTTVPGSIGNPASNPSYWIQTGFYNGQIASLQSQIDDINNNIGDLDNLLTTNKTSLVNAINEIVNDISNIKDKKFIILLDSYGGYRDADNHTLAELVATRLGAQASDAHTFGGYGFTNVNGVGTFLQAIQSLSIDDPDAITDIVVLGGQNDYGRDSAAIMTAISAFVTYCNTEYPNAKISIGHISEARNTQNYDMRYAITNSYYSILAYRNCYKVGARYLNGVEYIMHSSAFYENTDCTHPGTNGVSLLAHGIEESYKRGCCYTYITSDVNFNVPDDISGYSVTLPSDGTYEATIMNDIASFNVIVPTRRITITNDNPTYLPAAPIKIGKSRLGSETVLMVGSSSAPFFITIPVMILMFASNDSQIGRTNGFLNLNGDGDLLLYTQVGVMDNPNTVKYAYVIPTSSSATCQSILC